MLRYLAISLVMSLLVSADVGRMEIVESRSPYTILEVEVSKVDGIEPNGHIYGHDSEGYYMGFGSDSDSYHTGDTVVSLFLWNPANNYCDDVIARYDVAVFSAN